MSYRLKFLTALIVAAPALAAGPDRVVPCRYDEDRFLAVAETRAGDSIVFLTDTGGGMFLSRRAARRLDLTVLEAGGNLNAALPAFRDDAAIADGSGREASFPVVAQEGNTPGGVLLGDKDGMLGAPWFADRAWTLDYPDRRLLLHPPGDKLAPPPEHRAPLGFQVDGAGKRTYHFPRIAAEVDATPIDFLLDTGATVVLTDAALASLRDGRPAERAASFISEGVFAGWRGKHPDWRVIEDADRVTGRPQPMIEVPQVRFAGHVVGPVWFARRPDRAFRERMSRWMDRPIEGALGGNAFRQFRLTIDYPAAIATFDEPPAR